MNNEKQELKDQRVEHGNLVYVVTVTRTSCRVSAIINGERHSVYPIPVKNEPWTTNVQRYIQQA